MTDYCIGIGILLLLLVLMFDPIGVAMALHNFWVVLDHGPLGCEQTYLGVVCR